jgi:hypothetical protein
MSREWGKGKVDRFFVRKPEGKNLLGRTTREDFKTDLGEID